MRAARKDKYGASMRPPEFTGGNDAGLHRLSSEAAPASMRPPEFTGGNKVRQGGKISYRKLSFNEAAGIHRRKLGHETAKRMMRAARLQ